MFRLDPTMVFDVAMVFGVVATVEALKGIRWIRSARGSKKKARVKILAGIVAAMLSVPFTLRARLTNFYGFAAPIDLVSDWFVRALLCWALAMGAFDGFKFAYQLPTIFKPDGGDDAGDKPDAKENP